MKRLIVAALLALGVSPAFAQAPAAVNGCQYLSSLPTLSDKQTNGFLCDVNGALRIAGSISATTTEHSTAAAPTYVEGTDNPLSGDLNGNLRVTGAGGSFPVTGTVTANQGTSPWVISAASLPLPTGAATSALQTTGNTALTTINTTLGSPFQAGGSIGNTSFIVTQATGSNLHAVLDASSAVIGHVINDASAAVIGHVIADTGSTTAVTGNVTVVQPTGTNLHTVLDSGTLTTLTTLTGITNALPAGANILGKVGIDQTTDITTNGVEIAPTAGAAAGMAAVVSSSLETGHVLKNSAGNLYGVEVVTTTAAGYLEVFNATTVPAAGAVTPVAACYVGAFGTCALNFMPPLVMATGISVAFSASTTPFTKTDSATAFLSGQVK